MTKFNSYNVSAGGSARLYTPSLDLSTSAKPLTFWMSHDNGYSIANDRIQIQVSTNGGTIWTDVGTAIPRYDATCSIACWKEHTVDLSAYAGQPSVMVGFLAISEFGNNIFVDDVKIGEPWAPCPYVTLEPNLEGSSCRGSTVDYGPLTARNVTPNADTLNITVNGNLWPTTVDPSSLILDPNGAGDVNASVQIPWWADPGSKDVVSLTATGQLSGLSDNAILSTNSVLVSDYTDLTNGITGHGTRDHSVVYYDGKLYKIGGYNGAVQAWLDIYDIATDTWTPATAMPAARYWMDCVVIDGVDPKIYCAGGYQASVTDTLYIYDINSDQWSTGTALPAARYAYSGVALGGKYYVMGGYTTTYQNTVIVYDPNTGLWDDTTVPAMSAARRYAPAGVIGGKIYIAGGMTGGSTFTSSAEVYDPVGNTWSSISPIPFPNGWVRAADGVLHDRYLMLAGGYAGDLTASNYMLVYDSVNDTWVGQVAMDHLIYSAEGDGDGNYFYIVSGRLYEGSVFVYSDYTTLVDECPAVAPEIEVTAPPLEKTLSPNETSTISFTIGNIGNVDLLWSLAEFPAADWLSELPAAGTILPQGSTEVVVTFNSAALIPDVYTTTLIVSNDDPEDPGITLPVTLTVTPEFDLGVTKSASPDVVAVGEMITYTLEVTNNGPQAAKGVELVDTLPDLVTFSFADPGCTEADGVVTCVIGSLAVDGTVSIDIVVTAEVDGNALNTVEVSSQSFDPDQENNTATVVTTINPAIFKLYLPIVLKH